MQLIGDETTRIEMPGGGWVEVKAKLSRGDRVKLQQKTVGAARPRGADGDMDMDYAAFLDAAEFALVEMVLKGWSLDERVSPEAIRNLDEESIDFLKERLNDLYATRSQEEKKASYASGATTSLDEAERLLRSVG